MNTSLLLTFSAISVVALVLFWLLFRRSNITKKLTHNYLIDQLKDQNLTDEQRKTYEAQLSKLLLQDGKPQNSITIVLVVALLAIPFSFLFYNKLGNPNAINYVAPTQKQRQAQNNEQQAPQMSMEEAMEQLEIRLEQNPDDVDGQMLYARSLISMKKYKKAVTAYRKSNKLAPNESIIITELAEAIALANNNRSFLGEPEELLSKAVELEPNNQKALWLLGMTFYEHKNFTKTNELWTKLYGMMSDEGAKEQLLQQLNDIRVKLGIEGISTETEPALATTNKTSLSIKISLDEKLKDKLKGKPALLYIYTKTPTGMPMPIAVIRQPLEKIVNDFPIEVVMNDSSSLQPNRKLSDFEQVKIGARISFTGNATPQDGDLQADELLVDLPYTDTVQLTIEHIYIKTSDSKK